MAFSFAIYSAFGGPVAAGSGHSELRMVFPEATMVETGQVPNCRQPFGLEHCGSLVANSGAKQLI
jgi:hypothetical protein